MPFDPIDDDDSRSYFGSCVLNSNVSGITSNANGIRTKGYTPIVLTLYGYLY